MSTSTFDDAVINLSNAIKAKALTADPEGLVLLASAVEKIAGKVNAIDLQTLTDRLMAAFNTLSDQKTSDFNTNAGTRTAAFDTNAAAKTKAVNDANTAATDAIAAARTAAVNAVQSLNAPSTRFFFGQL